MHLTQELFEIAIEAAGKNKMRMAEGHMELYMQYIAKVKPGDTICFGRHAVTEMIKPISEDALIRPITWRVLERKGSKLLMISEYVLDWDFFEEGNEGWDGAYIRYHLNGTCRSEWFSEAEKKLLCPRPDLIFLLSEDEVRRYFPTPFEACAPLIYNDFRIGKNNALIPYVKEMPSPWWTRTVNAEEGTGTYVDCFGNLLEDGIHTSADEIGVRPAIWIDTEKIGGLV